MPLSGGIDDGLVACFVAVQAAGGVGQSRQAGACQNGQREESAR